MTTQERNNIIKLQATLAAIEKGEHIFFNVTIFENLGLVKVWGKDVDNRTRYILTPKAKRYLSVHISDWVASAPTETESDRRFKKVIKRLNK